MSEAQVSNIMGGQTDDLTDAVDSCDYKTVIATGFLTFSAVNFLTRFVIPDSACQSPQQSWKWRNVATSFLHSLITGIWAPICFYQVRSRSNVYITCMHSLTTESQYCIFVPGTRHRR